jgi:hypothetical protein
MSIGSPGTPAAGTTGSAATTPSSLQQQKKIQQSANYQRIS